MAGGEYQDYREEGALPIPSGMSGKSLLEFLQGRMRITTSVDNVPGRTFKVLKLEFLMPLGNGDSKWVNVSSTDY